MTSRDLQAALETAIRDDDGSPARRRRRLDIVRQLVVALVDDLDDDAAERAIAGIAPLVRHDAGLEIEVRRELAFDLASVRDQRRAIAQLGAALSRARTDGLDREELELAADLASMFRESHHDLDAAAVLANTAERVSSRREHADGVEQAEALVDRGELDAARALLERLPPADDDREARALHDEIRRRLGEQLADPTDMPDTAAPVLDGRVRAYVRRPSSLPQGLVDGGLLGPDKILELSSGAIEAAADLDSESVFGPRRAYRCSCGRYRGRLYAGLVCRRCRVEVISATSRRVRCGHLDLPVRVVHPWYAAAARALLEDRQEDLARLDAEALAERLAAVDLDALAGHAKQALAAPGSNRRANQIGQQLALVEAFRAARSRHLATPEAIVMTRLLVVPPSADLGLDGVAIRTAYARVVEASAEQTRAAVHDLFATFAPAS